jgi:hypothetical protein
MAKTYNTIGLVSAGDPLTETIWNEQAENVNNFRVPPMVIARRTTNLTGYASDTAITWQSIQPGSDTDSMWSAGDPTKISITTAGLYLVSFVGRLNATATLTTVRPDILINASIAASTTATIQSLGTVSFFALSIVALLSDGDFLTAAAGVAGGSAYAIAGDSGVTNNQTRFSATWLGQAS